ncbi:MAG: deoxyribonuclease IV [Desulfopila sp.]|jgi:deoxyribonuclease-4|nr:deoxyribonuclease IV [Desulfopila sp.]
MPFFGAHESVSGGLHLAFSRIESVGGASLQIFTRNQRQWNPPELTEQEIGDFVAARQQSEPMEVFSHGSYLVNLASAKEELQQKSISAFVAELERCQQLGIQSLVFHPGSHGGAGVDRGIERCVRALDKAMAAAASETRVLVETTAGQGTGLGSRFEEIGAILNGSKYSSRLGVCIDTCHIFAAGYDIRSAEAYRRTMAQFDRAVGLEKIELFHINDSRKELNSRVDRHAHIGEGYIGCEGFGHLVNDARFAAHAMILETPKEKDLEADRHNLQTLSGLLRK